MSLITMLGVVLTEVGLADNTQKKSVDIRGCLEWSPIGTKTLWHFLQLLGKILFSYYYALFSVQLRGLA